MRKRVRIAPKGITDPDAPVVVHLDTLAELQSIGDLKWCKISSIH